MGLNQRQHSNRAFISIVQGKFAKRVTEDTVGAIKRIIKNKNDGSEKIVWEIIYDDVSGIIESLEINEDGQFGDQLKINMEDIGEQFTVTLSMSGREAKNFLCLLKNIKLSEPVILSPYNFTSKDDGRQVIGMSTMQGGVGKEFKVKPYFSKETPNGLPQVPEGADKDEFKLTMKQQEIYLKKWVKKFVEDNFKEAKPESKMQPNKSAEKIYTNASPDSGDLPF